VWVSFWLSVRQKKISPEGELVSGQGFPYI
jgi:hypothetical protein